MIILRFYRAYTDFIRSLDVCWKALIFAVITFLPHTSNLDSHSVDAHHCVPSVCADLFQFPLKTARPNRGANFQSASRQRSTISGTLIAVADLPGRRALRSASRPTSRLVPPPIKRSTVGNHAFPVAAAQVWNGLPEAVVSSSSLQTFRLSLIHI